MSIGSFFSELFGTNNKGNDSTVKYRTIKLNGSSEDFDGYSARGEIMRGAVDVGIDYIAACVAKCEIQTYKGGKYTRGKDWYRWNVRPNLNQSSTEFWKEVVYRLIKYREVLIIPIGEQLIIADSFSKEEKAIVPTIFHSVQRKGLTLNGIYNSTNSIYLSAEHSTSLSGLINGLGSVLDESLKIALKNYYMDGGEHGIVTLNTDKETSDEEDEAYEEYLEEYFSDFYNRKNAVAVLYEGMTYQSTKNNSSYKNSVITDIREITKEAYSKVGQALKVPPALLLGDVANINETVVDNLINFAVMPVLDDFVEVANAVMYSPDEYLHGNYVKVDYANIKYMDALECSAAVDKLRADGIYNTNELRIKFGEVPVDKDFAEDYVVTKNYAEAEGGE